MKRTELRIRRNFHVANRILKSIDQRYGISNSYPTARSTVPALIESARVLHADRRSGVSRDDVLQQHLFVPGEASDSPTDRPAHRYQRDSLLLPAGKLNSNARQRELSARDRFLPAHIRNRDSWIEDDYLFAQIGGSFNKKNICLSGEPDCGSGWSCDLCQEKDSVPVSYAPIEHPPFLDDLPAQRKEFMEYDEDLYFNPHLFSSIKIWSYEEFFQPTLFDLPSSATCSPPQFSDVLEQCIVGSSSISFSSGPNMEQCGDSFLPSCARINTLVLLLSVLILTDSLFPAQRPGVLALHCHKQVLLTDGIQHYVFDRGKC